MSLLRIRVLVFNCSTTFQKTVWSNCIEVKLSTDILLDIQFLWEVQIQTVTVGESPPSVCVWFSVGQPRTGILSMVRIKYSVILWGCGWLLILKVSNKTWCIFSSTDISPCYKQSVLFSTSITKQQKQSIRSVPPIMLWYHTACALSLYHQTHYCKQYHSITSQSLGEICAQLRLAQWNPLNRRMLKTGMSLCNGIKVSMNKESAVKQ